MKYIKSVFTSLLLLLLMTACNSRTTPEPPMPTAIMPVEPVSTPLSIETEPASESATGEPDLIAVKFIETERVIPVSLDPVSESQDVASQYLQATDDGSNLWAGGSIRDSNFFSLEIVSLNHDSPDLISVTFPLNLNITKATDSTTDLNILSPTAGGGGGAAIIFPSLPLQAGEFELMPDDPNSVTLMKDIQQPFYFFNMPCVQTGVFDLQFMIPYNVTGNMVTQERTFDYTIQIVCPESATLWRLADPSSGQIENEGRWKFQNNHYILQP